MRQAMAQDE